MDNLQKIQAELKAPKNQFNSFGKYAYRSAEDILEAVKPLLSKYGALLTISDDIVLIGDRIYCKAICTYSEGKERLIVSAFAREPETKKGMDDSQITGTASSYARKYALNGLFLIDDTKDADTNEQRQQVMNTPPAPIAIVKCPKCGRDVAPMRGRDGAIKQPADILKACGGVCTDCYKAMQAGQA